MCTFPQATVNAIERTLYGHVGVGLVELAIIALKLWVANTRPILAVPGRPTVVGANLRGAIEPAEAGLTPARAVKAEAVV